MTGKRRVGRTLDAIEDRLGLRGVMTSLASQPVPGGPRIGPALGGLLGVLFLIEILTGIALAMAYSPSVTDAWGSVYMIQHEMTLGWLVRGVHAFTSSALVVVAVLVRLAAVSSDRMTRVVVGAVVGGAVGNLVDRAFRADGGLFSGAVVDMVDLQWWPVFNLADAVIVVGGVVVVLRGRRRA